MKKLKIKDIVMIALLSALYMVLYMVSGTAAMIFGPFGHAISPGICGVFTGTVIYFMTQKVGKFGQFTILQAICMILFSIMGAGYIPWVITSMLAAIIADFIASGEGKTATWRVAVASGVFHVGQAFGSIIPAMFFMESYKEDWIQRGQTAEAMDEIIRYVTGAMGVVATVVVFVLSVAGVYIGYLILRKHFERREAKMA